MVTGRAVEWLKYAHQRSGVYLIKGVGAAMRAGAVPVPMTATPLESLNNVLNWRPGQSYVIAARPGGGKTTFMQNFAVDAAQRTGGLVLYFSVEMPTDVMAIRALSASAGVPTRDIERGRLGQGQMDRIMHAHNKLAQSVGQVFLFHVPRMSIGMIATVTRRVSRTARLPVAMIVADYLQRFKPLVSRRDRVQELEEMAGEVLAVGQTYRCPVLVGSQLNRDGQLKGADAPLEDAAGLMVLDRTGEEEVTMTIQKNRFGPSTDDKGERLRLPVGFDAATGRIYDKGGKPWTA